MASKHATRKSHKTDVRDKAKHSDKLDKNAGGAKKGGAGGKGTWGAPGSELKYQDDASALDEHDPNYDPLDAAAASKAFRKAPEAAHQSKFVASIEDLNKFKTAIKEAFEEYLASDDAKEFANCVRDLDMSIYHQDIPSIVIKLALDKEDDSRKRIAALLRELFRMEIVTSPQMTQGFSKVFNVLDDLLLDAPNAKAIVSEFVNHAVTTGSLNAKAAADMEAGWSALTDAASVKKSKLTIENILQEYFVSEDVSDVAKSIKELNTPWLHFEFVKKAVILGMDRGSHERHLASCLIGELTGDVLVGDQVIKGFNVLLGRVEDLFLDIPKVLELLSCFVARAVADECLPPAFLLRVDLSKDDMGFQVLTQAQKLLDHPHARQQLGKIWSDGQEEADESGSETPGKTTAVPQAKPGSKAAAKSGASRKDSGASDPKAKQPNQKDKGKESKDASQWIWV